MAATPPLGRLTGNYPATEIRLVDDSDVGPNCAASLDKLYKLQASYELRTDLRPIAADKRIQICGTRVFGDPEIVTQDMASGERRARWRGVILCNRMGCPVCSAARARKFHDRVLRTLGAGGVWQHVIVTVPHARGDSWRRGYEHLVDGIGALTKGQVGRVMGPLVEAKIRATETTWSERSGWHVHCHLLWRVKVRNSETLLLEAEKQLVREAWANATGAHPVHGLRFGASFDCSNAGTRTLAANYMTKLASEMSGGHKRAHPEHFTLGEVYQRATQNDPRFVALVQQYQRETKGRRLYQFDRRAMRLHDSAPELPELVVLREWHTSVDRAEFSGLSRAERYGRERLAVYMPLEVAARSRGDPGDAIADAIDALLRAFDSG